MEEQQLSKEAAAAAQIRPTPAAPNVLPPLRYHTKFVISNHRHWRQEKQRSMIWVPRYVDSNTHSNI
ncbi:hypothetical protein RhiTH_001946 [Rhizoctonia solani]